MCRTIKLSVLLVLPMFFGTVEGSKWSETGECNFGRTGAESVGLTNGRFMVMGCTEDVSAQGYKTYEIFDPATGTWVQGPLPGSSTHWSSHTLAMLLYNGKVLYLWGQLHLYDPFNDNWTSTGLSFSSWSSQTCFTMLKDGNVLVIVMGNSHLYDYVSTTLTPTTGRPNSSHSGGVEILLPSGKVLIAGGSSSPACELYDPASGTWSNTGSMKEGRYQSLGVLLPPPWNKVLVTTGYSGNKSELYNLSNTTWAYTGDQNYSNRSIGAMALLPSGKALIVGGQGDGSGKECEIYDPDLSTWSIADNTQYRRNHFTLAVLPTGKIIAVGSHEDAVARKVEIYDPSDGIWTTKSHALNTERAAHTITPLPIIHTSGCSTNILIVGGENSTGPLNSCELYNYKENTVILTGSLADPRSHHTAILLNSDTGEVLVIGGKTTGGATISSCELFDIADESWNPAGNMNSSRFDHTATLLKDGDVLVTGGEDAGTYLSSCEIYNSGSWTPTANPMATPRARHTAIILLNGDILVIGGQTTGGGATNICELWDGTSWTSAANLTTARYLHTATLLQSGRVLVIGGTSDGSSGLLSCEIFDPDSNKWFPEGDLNTARYAHNTTLLYSGLVLVTGGNGGISSCEIWDPATAQYEGWKITTSLAAGRAYHSSVLIPYLKPYIYTIGGEGSGGYLNSIEQYDVGLGYREIWQSTITNYPSVTRISDSMDIEGMLFRGVSEADGGNHCHVASNDHPIISLVRIGGGNWQGNGGGEILHMPLSSDWNETHTTVHPEIADFQGYYRLWSIVNGIPCKWYEECELGAEENQKLGIRSQKVEVFPNPSPGTVCIKFATHRPGLAVLSVYDCAGRLTRKTTENYTEAGAKEIKLDGLKSGIYFYRIEYGDLEHKGKFIITR